MFYSNEKVKGFQPASKEDKTIMDIDSYFEDEEEDARSFDE
jgi:hypothetical protein